MKLRRLLGKGRKDAFRMQPDLWRDAETTIWFSLLEVKVIIS